MQLAMIRSLVPCGTPLMACTATATPSITEEVVSILEMAEPVTVRCSPNRPNIMYEVRNRTEADSDFAVLLSTLREKCITTPRVIVYCRTLTMCADMFDLFSFEMGSEQYHPVGAPEVSDNRLFGMFHAKTPQSSKEVIIRSLLDPQGVVRIVFASLAIGMGVDLRGVNTIVHYGAPSSMEDYFQASGRGGRSGESAHSIVYWKPSDCAKRKNPSTTHHREVNEVRRYLENSSVCRRKWLLNYFDPMSAKAGDDPLECCDVCASRILQHVSPASNRPFSETSEEEFEDKDT